MDAREGDSSAVPFSGPLPRYKLNRKLTLRLVRQMGALQLGRPTPGWSAIPKLGSPDPASTLGNLLARVSGWSSNEFDTISIYFDRAPTLA